MSAPTNGARKRTIDMAHHIDTVQQIPLSRKTYSEVRSQLKTGDLLFVSGHTLTDQAIQHITRSPWSHVALIVCTTFDRILLLESVEIDGVRLAPMSTYLDKQAKPLDGAFVIARHSGVASLTGDSFNNALSFAADQLGKHYNNCEIAEILSRFTLGISRENLSSGWICSELVGAVYQSAGLDIPETYGFVTPEALWLTQDIEPLAVIS